MVEGEFFGCYPGVAVVAATFGNAVLPPLALAQFTCGVAFFAQLLFGNVYENIHPKMMAQAGLRIQAYASQGEIYTGFSLFQGLKQQVCKYSDISLVQF